MKEVLDKTQAEIELLKSAKGRELARLQDTKNEQLEDLRKRYETRMSASALEKERMARHQREQEERLARVQALFGADEAEVLLKQDDVVIEAFGFDFKPGRSEIIANNFPLLNKIITVISFFPHSRVHVIGHTDTTGSKPRNLMLSAECAANVAMFLTDVGRIAADRIQSEGLGSDRPFASNETPAGRAKNRRIELRISRLEPLTRR